MESLYNLYKLYPYAVSSKFVYKIFHNSKKIAKKLKFDYIFEEYKNELQPIMNLFAINVFGKLFPQNILEINQTMLNDIYKCLHGDDIYIINI